MVKRDSPSCIKRVMQNYLNEFMFKFNRKAHPKSSFNKVLEKLA